MDAEAAEKAVAQRQEWEAECVRAIIGYAKFDIFAKHLWWAFWNEREVNSGASKGLAGDFGKFGLHNFLAINAVPLIVKLSQIDIKSLVPASAIDGNIGDVVWTDEDSKVKVPNGRHRKFALKLYLDGLAKDVLKANKDLEKIANRTGAAAEARTKLLIDAIAKFNEKMGNKGSWLGVFYDAGE